jgi:hypothetical protein
MRPTNGIQRVNNSCEPEFRNIPAIYIRPKYIGLRSHSIKQQLHIMKRMSERLAQSESSSKRACNENVNVSELLQSKQIAELFEIISCFSGQQLDEQFSHQERCMLFLHSGLRGKLELCERLAGTVDLSSDDMTDAVLEVILRDRVSQATKSGLVAGLVRNGAADDVVNRTRAGLLEVAQKCLNDIVLALSRRDSSKAISEIGCVKSEIKSFLSNVEDRETLDTLTGTGLNADSSRGS